MPLSLTSKQRSVLKSLAHHLEPTVMVGKNGVTENLITKTDDALLSHELIKIRFVDFKDKKRELTEQIAERTQCAVVGIIGHVAILFRENPDVEKRQIRLPV